MMIYGRQTGILTDVFGICSSVGTGGAGI